MTESREELLARVLDAIRFPGDVGSVDVHDALTKLGLRRESLGRSKYYGESYRFDVNVSEKLRWVRRGPLVAIRRVGSDNDTKASPRNDHLYVLSSPNEWFSERQGFGKLIDVTSEDGPWWAALATDAAEILSAMKQVDTAAHQAKERRLIKMQADKDAARAQELATARRSMQPEPKQQPAPQSTQEIGCVVVAGALWTVLAGTFAALLLVR
jgi:hypothetical protein